MKRFLIYSLLGLLVIGCNESDDQSDNDNSTESSVGNNGAVNLQVNLSKNAVTWGEAVELKFSVKENRKKVDSVLVSSGEHSMVVMGDQKKLTWPTSQAGVGTFRLKAKAFYADNTSDAVYKTLTVYSDIIPKVEKVVVLNRFPHDKKAYTQGLEIVDGQLYEGCGDWTNSDLRHVDLKTGAVKKNVWLNSYGEEMFGEGITILNDEIFQLTWQNRKGFVYDKSTLRRKTEWAYQFKGEGWGLTNDGQSLIVSTGDEHLHFLDPKTFQVKKSLQVYNEHRKVLKLNELEYVDGVIFANVYLEDFFLAIDAKTGKVLKKFNCYGVLDRDIRANLNDGEVLNGLAYDKRTKKFYITGKHWPVLLEIKKPEILSPAS